MIRTEYQSEAISLIHPRCSRQASSAEEGRLKLPRRSKRKVRDYQYLSLPELSRKTRMGSSGRSRISSSMVRKVGWSG